MADLDHLRLPDAEADMDHELADRLIRLNPPRDADIAERMYTIRAAALDMAHLIVDIVPRSPDRTVAIRAIHQACLQSIGALRYNQELVPESNP